MSILLRTCLLFKNCNSNTLIIIKDSLTVKKTFEVLRCYSKKKGQEAPRSKKALQKPRNGPAVKKRGSVIVGLPLLVSTLSCAYMVYHEYSDKGKGAMLERMLHERLGRPPRPLPRNLLDLGGKDQEYQRFVVRGTFEHDKELFMGPVDDTTNTQRKDTGVYVITPFKLADRDETILINRGHVPWRFQPHQKRQKGQIKEEVEIIGVNRLHEKEPWFAQFLGPSEKNNAFRFRDVDLFSKYADCAPVFLEADINATIPGGPMAGQTNISSKDVKEGTIALWAVLTGFCYFMFYRCYKNPKLPKKYKTVLETYQY